MALAMERQVDRAVEEHWIQAQAAKVAQAQQVKVIMVEQAHTPVELVEVAAEVEEPERLVKLLPLVLKEEQAALVYQVVLPEYLHIMAVEVVGQHT